MASVKDDVVALERRFWDESANPKFFDEAMADNAITVLEPMGFIAKEDAVKMSADAKGWTDVEMKDVHVVELTPDCVAVAYHGQGKQKGSKEAYHGSICSVYVRKNGRWQLGVSSHQPWKPK